LEERRKIVKCLLMISWMLLSGLCSGIFAQLACHAQETTHRLSHPLDIKSMSTLSNSSLPASAEEVTRSGPPAYHETDRPQFHFSAKQGWLNDPNGLMYFDGEYHLFFQFESQLSGEDPRKSWGHAVSPDLLHWHQLDDALQPDALGPIWSGSAVVDWNNTSGFGNSGKPPLVALYTAAGGRSPESQGRAFTQCLVYSLDHGRTWTKYAHNPVLAHIVGENRDPKVVWYAPTRRWIMALFLDKDQFGLFASPDLKAWTPLQTLTLPGSGECPDFFQMPLEGTGERRWVFTAANGKYLVGSFNGTNFLPETPLLPGDAGKNSYAAQTFSDIPAHDGRRIQIAWMIGGVYPNMPFNQQMSFPCALTLHATPDGPRLYRWPVREIAGLYREETRRHDIRLRPGADYLLPARSGDLWDVQAEFAPETGATAFGLRVRGADIRYHVADGIVSCLGRQVPLPSEHKRITLRFLLDRTSLEVFGNGGRVSLTSCFRPSPSDIDLSVYAEGGAVALISLTIHSLRSAWAEPSPALIEHSQ